jgi:hypothetical protein
MIGYGHPEDFSCSIDLRRKTQALREELMARISAMFPGDVSITRPGGRWRTRLRLKSGLTVSVLIGRPVQIRQTVRWRIETAKRECGFVTLLARLDRENRAFLDFHVFPTMDLRDRFHISLADPWLNDGAPLHDLLAFCRVVAIVRARNIELGGD